MLEKGIVGKDELHTTTGQINHVRHILLMGRYFFNQLRYQLSKCKKWGRQKLADWDQEDLDLWIIILHKSSTKGVNIKNVTCT